LKGSSHLYHKVEMTAEWAMESDIMGLFSDVLVQYVQYSTSWSDTMLKPCGIIPVFRNAELSWKLQVGFLDRKWELT